MFALTQLSYSTSARLMQGEIWWRIGSNALSSDSVPRAARGVYGISVASELTGIDPQTLRLYERRGLLTPARTAGGTRRYSDDDLDRLQRITELVDAGINIAGIAQILTLEHRNAQLASDNSHLESEYTRLRSDEPTAPPATARAARRAGHR
jgi:MerR family transcriptional regulator/heat shock protein HspR